MSKRKLRSARLRKSIPHKIDLLFWNPAHTTPTKTGWYACMAVDDRWDGKMRYRAWGNGLWWIPLKGGWLSGRFGTYRWRGPVANIHGPAPDGTDT